LSSTIVYIGSFSSASGEGISAFALDPATGKLAEVFEPVHAPNPAYLAFSHDQKILYTVLETSVYNGQYGGGVAAFAVDKGGCLTLINTQPTLGRGPCHLCADSGNDFLLAANYKEGTCSVFPLAHDGSISPCSSVTAHTGSGPNKERQDAPHVHFACFTPDEKYSCTVDLGTDKLNFYRLDKAHGRLLSEDRLTVSLRPGSGPRHLVFAPHRNFAYLIHEISNEISVFKYSEGYNLELIQCVSTLPTNFKGSNTAAAIVLSQNGRFLYASNRGHDSIAVYEVGGDGRLALTGIYSCGGNGPRDIAIEPDGNYLLVANEASHTVTVLKLNHDTGALEPTEFNAAVHSPVCIKFKKVD
jgi:6-phosphogluconolactonase